MGAALPEDAWLRYGHARGELAAIDAKIQALKIDGMVRQGLIDDRQTSTACDLLDEQADAAAAFGEAAGALRDSLRSA